jgi:hypothetical protein
VTGEDLGRSGGDGDGDGGGACTGGRDRHAPGRARGDDPRRHTMALRHVGECELGRSRSLQIVHIALPRSCLISRVGIGEDLNILEGQGKTSEGRHLWFSTTSFAGVVSKLAKSLPGLCET